MKKKKEMTPAAPPPPVDAPIAGAPNTTPASERFVVNKAYFVAELARSVEKLNELTTLTERMRSHVYFLSHILEKGDIPNG